MTSLPAQTHNHTNARRQLASRWVSSVLVCGLLRAQWPRGPGPVAAGRPAPSTALSIGGIDNSVLVERQGAAGFQLLKMT